MEERILEYLDAAEQALATYGPMAVEGTLMWARIDAASGLFRPLLLTLLFGVLSLAWTNVWGKTWKAKLKFWKESSGEQGQRSHYSKERAEDAHTTWAVFGSIPVLLPWTVTFLCSVPLMNLWRWVGIFVPELWLVHRAISAVGG